MRFVLALLSSFLLLNAQIYAIPAGPVFDSGSGGTNTIGSYAGLLVPNDSGDTSDSVNALGLFTLIIPASGLGTGTFVMFTTGRTYTGTITGFADSDSGQVNAVMQATFADTIYKVNYNDGTTASITGPSYTVGGNFRATVTNETTGFSTAVGRISGAARIETTSPSTDANGNAVTPTKTVQDFTVDGVQQSNTTTS